MLLVEADVEGVLKSMGERPGPITDRLQVRIFNASLNIVIGGTVKFKLQAKLDIIWRQALVNGEPALI